MDSVYYIIVQRCYTEVVLFKLIDMFAHLTHVVWLH